MHNRARHGNAAYLPGHSWTVECRRSGKFGFGANRQYGSMKLEAERVEPGTSRARELLLLESN